MKPSIGSIVLFCDEDDTGELVESPAIVRGVRADKALDLVVFGQWEDARIEGVVRSDGPSEGCWRWPPRAEEPKK